MFFALPAHRALGVWAVAEGAASVLVLFKLVNILAMMIDEQFDRLFEVLADVPENATTTARKDVQLGHPDFGLP